MNRTEMISQLLSLAPQEAKACPECQDPRVSQVSQDLRDSQDSLDPQDNMGSQELLAERDPWGCQAPPALEVRLQHPRMSGALAGANGQPNMVFSWVVIKLCSKEPPRTARGPQNKSYLLSKKKFKQL